MWITRSANWCCATCSLYKAESPFCTTAGRAARTPRTAPETRLQRATVHAPEGARGKERNMETLSPPSRSSASGARRSGPRLAFRRQEAGDAGARQRPPPHHHPAGIRPRLPQRRYFCASSGARRTSCCPSWSSRAPLFAKPPSVTATSDDEHCERTSATPKAGPDATRFVTIKNKKNATQPGWAASHPFDSLSKRYLRAGAGAWEGLAPGPAGLPFLSPA